MAIPDHVKKQAMDAVSNKVTTAQIRLYCNNDQPAVFNSEDKTASAIQKSASAMPASDAPKHARRSRRGMTQER
jgi:hypothetical protein